MVPKWIRPSGTLESLMTRTRQVIAGIIGVIALFSVGCSGSDSELKSSDTNSTESTTDPSSTAETTKTTAQPKELAPLGSGKAVTIAFAGDASFEGLSTSVVSNTTGLLSAIEPVMSAADISMVNVETAVGTGGTAVNKEFTFQVPAEALDSLDAAGVDVVTMANNHGMDFGKEGFADTLRIKSEGKMPIIGIGKDDTEAYAPYIKEVNGQRIGIIAANDIYPSSMVTWWTAAPGVPGIASAEEAYQEQLAQAVRDLRPTVNTLAVYLHFGTEKETCPNARQKELVDLMISAGADIVVGTHAHRLQGIGYQGDQLVAFGLSNFIFKAPSAAGNASGVLVVTATGRRIDGYDWKPVQIQNLVPVPLSGAAATAGVAAMDALQSCAGLSPTATGPGFEDSAASSSPTTTKKGK
ncbi:unannotated protein [freshwater metagenome]|uniref:Unannotated protein n=1 Tax=freshwater metagenome TaxID=449393 RepID=A0A6J7HXU2_9ZZZZ|nr:CapA family protein [Actinomycetota bacterium]